MLRQQDELSFRSGDILLGHWEEGNDWWVGTDESGRRGIFPIRYTEDYDEWKARQREKEQARARRPPPAQLPSGPGYGSSSGPSAAAAAGGTGCTHYQRLCKAVPECCAPLYWCRKCHDLVAGHPLRSLNMQCTLCNFIQPNAKFCLKATLF